ncbi:hypothetical protein ABBQ38_007926 [Trebouxia sp. C0009 RCD-2024]
MALGCLWFWIQKEQLNAMRSQQSHGTEKGFLKGISKVPDIPFLDDALRWNEYERNLAYQVQLIPQQMHDKQLQEGCSPCHVHPVHMELDLPRSVRCKRYDVDASKVGTRHGEVCV